MNNQKKRLHLKKKIEFDTRKSGFGPRMKIIFLFKNRLDERKVRVDVAFILYFVFFYLIS